MVQVIETRWGKNEGYNLSRLIERTLDPVDNESGAVEAAARTADNCAEALGLLIDLLVSKNAITLDDALRVAGMACRDIRLADDQN